MTHLEIELARLKQSILEMMHITKAQLERAKLAFLEKDNALATEIIHNEKRVNAMELSIDRDCENIFALFQPVATNLRFVISVLKINSDLERIADYAEGLAKYVLDLEQPIHKSSLEQTKMPEMFDITISMLSDIAVALNNEDTSLARKVYMKDAELNTINSNASRIIKDLIAQDKDAIRRHLFLFSAVRKLERVGDHIKNIAEDTIFFIEAEILKHRTKKS